METPDRRTFLKNAIATAAVPPLLATSLAALEGQQSNQDARQVHFVGWGEDRLGTPHKGPREGSHLLFKISSADTGGGLFLLEYANIPEGGPVRHLHFEQEEWFYLIEGGEIVIEVGDKRMTLKPGDCVLAPRMVPHVWAYRGEKPGRMLLAFSPAGKMEDFFIETSKAGRHMGNSELMLAHGMKLIGPPLKI